MLKKIKNYLVNNFPQLGRLKRLYVAYRDTVVEKESYSQHGEDKIIAELLKDFDLSKGKYIDVGANHPTDISNTYAFYKKGYTGITVEPVAELVKLHQKIRPKDMMLPIGISDEPGLISFNVTKFPVISSFDQDHITSQMNYSEDLIWKKIFIPVLTLDVAMENMEAEWFFFLSIDVEGLDFKVLKGAQKTLEKTYCVLIEFGTEDDVRRIKEFLTGFNFERQIGCNLLFINKSEKFTAYRIN